MEHIYIQLFSPHGLIRYNNAEIGRDKDTGGQVKYVLELMEALSLHPQVRKVDLFTRLIKDKRVSPDYAEPIEIVNDKARIVRIPCGGGTYRHKEQLWTYLNEFIDKTIRFIEKQNDFPSVVHGHYADGNYIAGEISKIFSVPYIATGHSLGRNKKRILLNHGWDEKKINEKFHIERRIVEEEKSLQEAQAIIVSTHHEISSQYDLYTSKKNANFTVIPPGINADIFYPFYKPEMPSFEMSDEQEQALYRVNSEIERFLFKPEKPLILSIGRADKRKNFEAIISAYGQDKELQAMANLAIFAGVRKDITQMPADEQEILTNLLLLMDKYDLYGKMAIPKKNDPAYEVPEIYRIAARKKGVFVNATPGENFGLTIVEAASCGLPVIASPTGGPKEIITNADNGILVDVSDTKQISDALKKIVADTTLWENFSANGIKAARENYTWKAHAEKYMEVTKELLNASKEVSKKDSSNSWGKKLVTTNIALISDLDGTLVDEKKTMGLNELKQWIEKEKIIFGISTGRNKELTKQAFKNYNLPDPDVLICSAGTEIYYTKKFIADKGWENHINHQWKRKELEEALRNYAKIKPQEKAAQWEYKLSFYVSESFNEDDLADLHKYLDDKKLRAQIFLTDNKYLDIVPVRAGKGNAVRYISYKWQIPLENIITSGNGGNDISMLRGSSKGIVVANHSPELNILKKSKDVYFAKKNIAEGVLEGIMHYYPKIKKK